LPRKSTSRRTPVQKALIELRRLLGETQQSMSDRLGVSLQSVARWETTEPPVNITLATLHQIAVENNYVELAQAFRDALETLKEKQRRKVDDIMDEINRWHHIREHLTALADEAQILTTRKHPAGPRIEEHLNALHELLGAAQKWSWRNR
jgi:transcriptional regulator with XRE-family HTH domain